MTRSRRVAVALLAAGAVAACGEGPTGPTGPPPITSVTIAPGSAAADAVGDTLQFTATVRDSTGATRTGVVVAWNSDKPDVVRSIGQGKFIAEGEGSAIVVGKVGAVADTATATVQQVVTSVALTAPDTNVRLGGTLTLSATARDGRGNPVAATFTWSVSEPQYATIDATGKLTGLDPGPLFARVAVGTVRDSVRLRTVTSYVAADAGTGTDSWRCAPDVDGRVLCWGSQLLPYWGTDQYLPRVIQPGPFALIGVGEYYACGLDGSLSAWCWGDNANLRLGTASAGSGSEQPVPVDGNHTFMALSVGPTKSCGVRIDGIGICWGLTAGGQLGRDTTGDAGLPDEVEGGHLWRAISARSGVGACGVTQSDSLFCWGDNSWGILGGSLPAQSSAPVAVRPDLSFSDVAVGVGPIACAITVTGDVYCWGAYTDKVPTPVTLPSAAIAITAGAHACAIVYDASAYCWAGDLLGDGTNQASNTPQPVAGGYDFAALSQGPQRTCGLAFDGRIYCWGTWTGDGTSEIRYAPVRVAGQP